jgi:hypothetical protein
MVLDRVLDRLSVAAALAEPDELWVEVSHFGLGVHFTEDGQPLPRASRLAGSSRGHSSSMSQARHGDRPVHQPRQTTGVGATSCRCHVHLVEGHACPARPPALDEVSGLVTLTRPGLTDDDPAVHRRCRPATAKPAPSMADLGRARPIRTGQRLSAAVRWGAVLGCTPCRNLAPGSGSERATDRARLDGPLGRRRGDRRCPR